MKYPSPFSSSCLFVFAFAAAVALSVRPIARAAEPATTRPATRPAFEVGGEPVHPLLVKLFCGWPSDGGPVVRAVDVSAARGTDEFGAPFSRAAGDLRCDVPDTDPPEWFAYRQAGTLADGTFVLVTRHNAGGTGIFMNLLLVRLSPSKVSDEGHPRDAAIMTVVDAYPLGDRDDGRVEVLPDRIVIGPSRNRETPLVVRVP